MELTPEAFRDLKGYLLGHEIDIALGINDFDELRLVFRDVIGRDASPKVLGATTTI